MTNAPVLAAPGNSESPDTTEALLEGLIAECHAMIRDVILPAARAADHADRRQYLGSANHLMDSAVKLGDAIGRLRGTAPLPELRQRITVEKIERQPAAARRLSPPRGERG